MELQIVLFALLVNSVFCVKEKKVKFFIYSARQPVIPMHVPKNQINMIDIDRKKDIKILCHGWMDSRYSFWIEPTKNSLMTRHETNIVAVDWERDSYRLYSNSVSRLKPLAKIIASWVLEMSKQLGIPMERFHFIGHSLGAHLLGFAAKQIYNQTRTRVGRITGLDPAGPLFNLKKPFNRLDSTDALFVDVIHTESNLAGYETSIGHVDFWPNGGALQEGCRIYSSCSHNRAPLYYEESVTSYDFSAWKCDSMAAYKEGKCFGNSKTVMGENVDKNARGDYYLGTNKEKPFACNC